jgi:hypothetical protein
VSGRNILKLEIEREARLAIAGALIGGLLGAVGIIVYNRTQNSDEAPGQRLIEAKGEVLSLQRMGTLAWAIITLVREILDFGRGE